MKTRRFLPLVAVTFVAYGIFTAFVVFWPTKIDQPLLPSIKAALADIHAFGVPEFVNYGSLEFSSNVFLFIPLGMLVAAVLAPRAWWVSPIVGLLVAIAIEVVQAKSLPGRSGNALDVVADTAGALVGALIVLIVRSLVQANKGRSTAVLSESAG